MKHEAKKEDLDSVIVTENWEKTILKEFRPDWRDPDDDAWFFDKDMQKKDEVAGKGVPAKGGKAPAKAPARPPPKKK